MKIKKQTLFFLFLICEAGVFGILPISSRVRPMSTLLIIHATLTGIFLILAWFLKRNENGKVYWQLFYAFFVAGLAILVSTVFTDQLLNMFGLAPTNPRGMAAAKFFESLLRVLIILVLIRIVGVDWRSLYLQKGKIVLGLVVGIITFIILAAVAFIPFGNQNGMTEKLLSLSPWILIFVFANGFMEELLYRGLFLKGYEKFLGKWLSNLLAAIVFTLVHVQVMYVSQLVPFLIVTFILALLWGYLMQKTDSLWGSMLFHAGADCMIILGVFAHV
jgi:membrane protease YdiL (CAAX protease family)